MGYFDAHAFDVGRILDARAEAKRWRTYMDESTGDTGRVGLRYAKRKWLEAREALRAASAEHALWHLQHPEAKATCNVERERWAS